MLRVNQLAGFSAGAKFAPSQTIAPALLSDSNVIYDPAVTGGWSVTFSASLDTNDAGWSNNTLRVMVPGSLLSTSGTHVRITLQSSSSNTLAFDKAYIGEKAASGDAYDMKASTPSPTQFLFSGVGGTTISTNSQVTSDDLTFTIDETKDYVFSFHINSGAMRIKTGSPVTGAISKYKSGDEASTADVTGYSDVNVGTNVVALIAEIEVY